MSSVFVSTSSDDQTLIDNKVTQTEEKNDDQKLIDNEATQTEEKNDDDDVICLDDDNRVIFEVQNKTKQASIRRYLVPIDPDNMRQMYFMSEADKRASNNSFLLWKDKGDKDCSECKNLKTPCDATLFMLPKATRRQLLKRCGRKTGKHFMEENYCLLCQIDNPQSDYCYNNIWKDDGNARLYKSEWIQLQDASAEQVQAFRLYKSEWTQLQDAIMYKWKEMAKMEKITIEFVLQFVKRWDEIIGGDLPSYITKYLSKWKLIIDNVNNKCPCNANSQCQCQCNEDSD